MQWGVKIPMRDGICLNAALYMPGSHQGPSPVLLGISPYGGDYHHERSTYFARHGYPSLIVDVRGRGNSEGEFRLGHDAKDGYDVIEWLARQPYCNGQVGMWGGSYLGYSQWAAASECPPSLATIVPVAAPFRGVDSPVRNNVFTPYMMQWLTLVAGRTTQGKTFTDQAFWNLKFKECFEAGIPFKQLDAFVGNPSEIFQEYLAHPHRDAYWDSFNPTREQYSKLSIPILTITGAYDGDQPGALEHYRQYMKSAPMAGRARHYLIIGPWDHAGCGSPKAEFCGLKVGPASLVDLPKLHLEWYAWTMQGGPKPEFLQKHVAYYVTGAEQWRYAETLEAITSRFAPLYLQSTANPTNVFVSGSLTPELPASGEPDRYVYDPRDVSFAELESQVDPESLTDQRMLNAATDQQLIYHSAPFEKDTEISGFFTLSAWLAIDQPDTDFRAAVYEVALDGSTLQLSVDWLRARYRESLRTAKLIDTREPLRYDFEHFTFVSRQIRKGHRLRLTIGPIHSIYWQKNYNSGGVVAEESLQDARCVTVRLFHDETHPSALYVPLGQPEMPT